LRLCPEKCPDLVGTFSGYGAAAEVGRPKCTSVGRATAAVGMAGLIRGLARENPLCGAEDASRQAQRLELTYSFDWSAPNRVAID
jgi:hypothetical protein